MVLAPAEQDVYRIQQYFSLRSEERNAIVFILHSYGARKTLSDRCYKHFVPTGRRWLLQTGRRLSAFVAITIALSFVATVVPVASASLTKMACCAGKDHCDSGITAKKVPPPKSEPMCGLHGAKMEADGITIVAQPVAGSHHSHSHTAVTNSSKPAAESASMSKLCHMDCASCATSATQQRERNTVQPAAYQNASLTTPSFDEDQSLLFSSNKDWEHVIPRGPPSSLR